MRAAFIIANMQVRPLCGGPISSPSAPSNSIVQVGLAWIPSLRSMELQRTPLRLPSALSLGTANSEMPALPGGASGSRASTMCRMFSVIRCSP